MPLTTEQRRARYRARVRRHPACGIRTNGTPPAGCLRCWMVEAYWARREQYLDAVEASDRQNEVQTPILPRVTFRYWLSVLQYPARDTPTP